MKRYKPNPERQAKLRDLARKLGAMSETEREGFAERLGTVVNPDGHALTMRNSCLLAMQADRMDLTMVAGFKQWISHGRVVQKGQKSIGSIMVPIQVKPKDRNGAPTGEKPELRFRWVAVFDVTQTEEIQAESEVA